jgi:hypothetical protein
MKNFLINSILIICILFSLMAFVVSLEFVIEAITSKKDIIAPIVVLMIVVLGSFFLLKWLFSYRNKNYKPTGLIILASILGIYFLWYIYITGNMGNFGANPSENTIANPDYKEEQDDIVTATANTDTLLFAKQNSKTQLYAYYDATGHKVLGDYEFIFTDTITQYGIVQDKGYFLIDKTGKHHFEIYPFDNGPDYPSEGLYRIIENGKIGYVDSLSSKLVIKPQYDCGFPFEHGKAKVSLACKTVNEGEHSSWESENWFYIDKKGTILTHN